MSKKLLLLGIFTTYKSSNAMQIATPTVTINREMHKKVFNLAITQENFSLGNGFTTMAAFAAKLGIFTLFFFQIPLITIPKNQEEIKKIFPKNEDKFFQQKRLRFTYDLWRLHSSLLDILSLDIEEDKAKNSYLFFTYHYFGLLSMPVILFNYNAYKDLNGYLWNIGWYFVAMLLINIILYKHEIYTLNKNIKYGDLQDEKIQKKYYAGNEPTKKLPGIAMLMIGYYLSKSDLNEFKNDSNRLHMFLMFNTPYVAALVIQMIRWNYIWKQVNQNISEKIIKISDTLHTEIIL